MVHRIRERAAAERKKQNEVTPPLPVVSPSATATSELDGSGSDFPVASDVSGHNFTELPVVDTAPSNANDVGVQFKLTVSQPGDPLENEADEVAREVVESTNGRSAPRRREVRHTSDGASVSASGDPIPNGAAADSVRSVVSGSGGQPIDQATRAFMEPRFGHSFSAVRVHTDSAAADSAAQLHARAYTVGTDVVFGAGQFQPETEPGRTLLAHELTHVIQQGSERADLARATGFRTIMRDPETATPPAPATGQPPNMGGATVPGQGVTAQFVRVTVSTGPDPEYTSNSRNTGSGTVTLSANPEQTYASLRELGGADMWNMACVVGNLANWSKSAPDIPPLSSPGGSSSVQIANANPADTAFEENYRAAFPHFKGHVQTFYSKFKQFEKDFKANGTTATLGLVAESRARTKKTMADLGISLETKTERGPMGAEPTSTYTSDSAQNKELSEVATDLATKQEALEKLLKKREDVRGFINWAITSEENLVKEEEALDKQVGEARTAWEDAKQKARKFPVLTHFSTTEQLKMLSNPASAAHNVGSKLNEILGNIDEIEEKLKAGDERILTLPEHLDRLKDAFNLNTFERHTVNYMREKYTGDIETGQRVGQLIAIVLAAIAAAPTGGGSLVFAAAAMGEAAINTAMLLQAYDQYSLEKAATGSNEDKAQALSSEEPSFFWLAFQVVTTLSGLSGNAKTVMTELKTAFNEIRAGYKAAAITGQTGQLEGALAAKKIPKQAAEGIVARAVKESLTILEGIVKGGPEGLQAALDLLKGSPSFYGARLAVWRIKAAANADIARQNLQLARQQIVNKIVEEQKGRFPKATFIVTDQGFEKPIIVKIGSSEPVPAPPSSGPPSSPPSGAPGSGTPTSGGPTANTPSVPPGPPSAHSAPTAKAPDEIPPDIAKTPEKPVPSGILVQAKKTPEATTATSVPSGSGGAPDATADLGNAATENAASPMGGHGPPVVAPLAKSVDVPQAGAFHPPMALPEGVEQAAAANEVLASAPQAGLGGNSAAIGADVSVQMEPTVAPYGPVNAAMERHYAQLGIAKPEYSGIYLNVSTRFTVNEELTRRMGGMGTSGKAILIDSAGAGADKPMFMFKPGGMEHVGVARAHEVRPGTFFIAGRASYDIALDLPTVGKDIVPMGIVVYNGRVGSLQPFIKNTESLGDLLDGKPLNPLLSKEYAKQLGEQIQQDGKFKIFRENLRAYDHVINNPDRNEWNFLVEFNDDMTVKRYYAIDQDLALKPGARSVMRKDREVIPRFAQKNVLSLDDLQRPNVPQSHLDKISKTLYDEFVQMKVNEASVREALAGSFGLDKGTLDGIFSRLDEVLADYNLRLQTMKPEDVFAN